MMSVPKMSGSMAYHLRMKTGYISGKPFDWEANVMISSSNTNSIVITNRSNIGYDLSRDQAYKIRLVNDGTYMHIDLFIDYPRFPINPESRTDSNNTYYLFLSDFNGPYEEEYNKYTFDRIITRTPDSTLIVPEDLPSGSNLVVYHDLFTNSNKTIYEPYINCSYTNGQVKERAINIDQLNQTGFYIYSIFAGDYCEGTMPNVGNTFILIGYSNCLLSKAYPNMRIGVQIAFGFDSDKIAIRNTGYSSTFDGSWNSWRYA